jgi:copper(I)-binding protein
MKWSYLVLVAMAAAVTATSSIWAADYKLGDLVIDHPWARASAGAANGAAYMVVTTSGAAPDQLIGASTPIAEKAELHTHLMEGDVMRMRAVKTIEVNPGEPATLEPGGLHVMLMGLKAPLKEGEQFPLTLTFEKAGSVTVDVAVEAAGATGYHEQGGHQH